jgi:acetylornithine/LysW-gamma-L-lysine aminotransferase
LPDSNIKLFSFQKFYPIEIVKAKKQYVWDSSGKKYVDFNTGNGIGFLGHGNPFVLRKIKEALSTIYILPPSFKSPIKEGALESLARIAPKNLDSVALLNTGSEAVELALKLLYKYKGKDKKIVYFTNSFHGRTLGALSITSSNPAYNKDFPLLNNTLILPYNDVYALDNASFENVAGVIVEVIQGEGGVIPAKEEFLKTLYEKCQANDAPLIIDEIQTGFGRTGKLWAFMHYNIKPDILLAGKSIGGGVPVSVVFAREEISSKLEAHEHGSTFGFNPIAAAGVAGAIEAYFKLDVESKVHRKSEYLINKIQKAIRDVSHASVRGKGLMIGISQHAQINFIFSCLIKKGVIISRAARNTVRLLPSFLITKRDIEVFTKGIKECWEEANGERVTEENSVRISSNTLNVWYGAKSS